MFFADEWRQIGFVSAVYRRGPGEYIADMPCRSRPFLSRFAALLVCAVWTLPLQACRKPDRPPPEAKRPVIKSRSELAQERQAGIRSGRIRPTTRPVLVESERRAAEARRALVPITLGPGAIRADMLMVNEQTITVAEILYALRDETETVRAAQTQQGFLTWARQTIGSMIRREIGSLLLYDEAVSNLAKEQHESLDKFVDQRLSDRIAREFGGRTARLEAHLAEFGLTLDVYRSWLKRDAVVSQYTREKFLPRISIPRHQLIAAWKTNRDSYTSPARRELFLIDVPFAGFLAEGAAWETAAESARAQARLEAMRHVRKISAALNTSPFEEVAREHSRGLKAAEGGSWGFLTTPLRAPYDVASQKIFEFEQGQVSEPIESERGWFIVKCGRIEEEKTASFVETQAQLRRVIENQRLNTLISNYVGDLAEDSTVSAADVAAFVESAAQRLSRMPASTTSWQP